MQLPVSDDASSEPQLKQYSFKLMLMCHVSVKELEWTTDVTNNALETTSTTKTSFYKHPGAEIDPAYVDLRVWQISFYVAHLCWKSDIYKIKQKC